MHETYWSLLCDWNHWLFELTLMAIFDGVIGLVLWPYVRKHWVHHLDRDKREGITPLSKQTKRVLCTSQYAGIHRVGSTVDAYSLFCPVHRYQYGFDSSSCAECAERQRRAA